MTAIKKFKVNLHIYIYITYNWSIRITPFGPVLVTVVISIVSCVLTDGIDIRKVPLINVPTIDVSNVKLLNEPPLLGASVPVLRVKFRIKLVGNWQQMVSLYVPIDWKTMTWSDSVWCACWCQYAC